MPVHVASCYPVDMSLPRPQEMTINLSDVARQTGLSVSYLSRLFAGHRSPSITTLKKVAAATGSSMDSLVALLSLRRQQCKKTT